VMRKQLHLWLSEADHAFLSRHATEREEAIAAIVRRLIRSWRHSVEASPTEGPQANSVRARCADVVQAPIAATAGQQVTRVRTN